MLQTTCHPCVSGCGRCLALGDVTITASRAWAVNTLRWRSGMTAMISRSAERVGLKWRKPPCPEPSRLDDWFLRVACAGSQRPAPGASLPEVHDEHTGCGRHLLLPETDLLTPSPSPPSVVQLGGIQGSPRWSGHLRCKCVLILSPPVRANRASSSGPVGTHLVSSGEAYVACGDAASTLRYGITAGSSG